MKERNMENKFYITNNNLEDFFTELSKIKDGNIYYLAGGSDINMMIKKNILKDANIFYLNEIKELKGIYENKDEIEIGGLETFYSIINSPIIQKYFPFLSDSLQNFASPLIQPIATIAGNIANGSPTADSVPLLLALNAKLILSSQEGERIVKLEDFFTNYKKNILQKKEIIKSILLPKKKINNYFYKKVSSRKSLSIAKLSIACIYDIKDYKFADFTLATGALNEYARRLSKIEKYFNGKKREEIKKEELKEILGKEIFPITDLRSDAEYRFNVCLNLIFSIALNN